MTVRDQVVQAAASNLTADSKLAASANSCSAFAPGLESGGGNDRSQVAVRSALDNLKYNVEQGPAQGQTLSTEEWGAKRSSKGCLRGTTGDNSTEPMES